MIMSIVCVLISTFMIRLVIFTITINIIVAIIAIITISTVVALITLAISFKATSREQEVGANLAGVWGSGGGQKAVFRVEALRGFWGLGFRA